MRLRLELVALVAVALGVIAVSQACLVNSHCLSDSDCSAPARCGEDGTCRVECSVSSPDSCPNERPICLFSEHRCVECLDRDDCVAERECLDNRCTPGMAPLFALFDRNPASPTFNQEIALADSVGSVVLLFFANAG